MNNHTVHNRQTERDQAAKCCIWMTAGVISYKLCPYDFNCEQCAFDAAMQTQKMEGIERRRESKVNGLGDNHPPNSLQR